MLTITRAERNVVHEHTMRELEMNELTGREEDHGRGWGEMIARHIAILDEIGWEPEGETDSYEISTDPEALRRVLQGFLDYAKEVYADDSREMFRFRDGPIPNDWVPDGWTDDQYRDSLRERVDHAAAEMAMIDALFFRALEWEREKVPV